MLYFATVTVKIYVDDKGLTRNVEYKYKMRIFDLAKTDWRGNSNCLKPKIVKPLPPPANSRS